MCVFSACSPKILWRVRLTILVVSCGLMVLSFAGSSSKCLTQSTSLRLKKVGID